MNKKYIVRLTDEERTFCEATIKKETGKSEKLRRATILLKADVDDFNRYDLNHDGIVTVPEFLRAGNASKSKAARSATEAAP